MKTKMNIVTPRSLGLVLLSATLAAPFQRASAQSDQDLIEVARSVVTADRKAVVVATMELTEAESKDFWPLYREYRAAMDKINDQLMDLVLAYAKAYPDIPEPDAKHMLDIYTSLQQKHVTERAAYIKKFENILPVTKALRFAQVETRLDLVIQLNLAARIPLTPIAAK